MQTLASQMQKKMQLQKQITFKFDHHFSVQCTGCLMVQVRVRADTDLRRLSGLVNSRFRLAALGLEDALQHI